MKNKLMFSTVLIVIVMLILLSACQGAPAPAPAPSPSPAPAPAPGKLIVLKGIGAFPNNHNDQVQVPQFVERLNKIAPAELKVEWVGGPEVIPAFDQGPALKKGGIVDIILFTPAGYLTSVVPEAAASCLAMAAPWEERKTGAYALWDEIYQKRLNAKFLGEFSHPAALHIYANFVPKSVEDFRGRPIRISGAWLPWITAIGASPVTIAGPEIYTGIERKVIDGYVWLNRGITGWGLQEVTKYRIDPGLFQADNAVLMNLDSWNKLPKHLQDAITNVCIDMEYIGASLIQNDTEKEWPAIQKAGLTIINLPPAEAEKYVKLGYDATWAAVLKNTPEYGPKLKEVLNKTVPRFGSK